MRTHSWLAFILILSVGRVGAAEPASITGRVVDDNGSPVADAAIDFFWFANGPLLDDEGKPLDLSTPEAEKHYWSRFGQMEPVVKTTSDAGGNFSLPARGTFHTLMAMNPERTLGGLKRIAKDHDGSPIEVRLERLVRVEATISSEALGVKPKSIMAVAEVPADPARPLASCRLVLAEARDSRLLMSLPPGSYVLDAYDDESKASLQHEFRLNRDARAEELGVLKLQLDKPNINQAIEQSQAAGSMGDFTQNYGKPFPAWHIVDAAGVAKDVELADFKGKWVVLNFWALNCTACLRDELPRLMKFYEDHEAQRDQFEILAICVSHTGDVKSMADVDRGLKPIVEHVWNGKPLPFPVLLDPSLTTLERFGVPGYRTLLIDPEGRLVEGNEETLAKELAENTQ